MHTDYTVTTEAHIGETQEREVDEFHTRSEAMEAAVQEHADSIAERIKANPGQFISVRSVEDPEEGGLPE